tara:strand:- start:4119 stop:4739 length:621 start_codon:yes stop_codon:yes gene_type:complete
MFFNKLFRKNPVNSENNKMLIVGLGNPGQKYNRTRHNIGFDVIDKLSKEFELNLKKSSNSAEWDSFHFQETEIYLIKPTTFMNNSGKSLKQFHSKLGKNIQFLVIYDDLDLPVGKIRLRKNGSAGGHNGIKSIISELGTNEFARIRIGISQDRNENTINYVLGKFRTEEQEIIEEVINSIPRVIYSILSNGFDVAMNEYNGNSINK